MNGHTPRHLEIINLTQSLQRYAGALQNDVNAAFLLVHEVIARALRNPAVLQLAYVRLEPQLRRDIDRAHGDRAHGDRAQRAAPGGCHVWG